MAARNAGVSGVAVTVAAAGIFAAYAGIRDVPLLEGLRAVLRGDDPSSLSRSGGGGYAGPVGDSSGSKLGSGPAGGAAFTGPVPIGETRVVDGIRVHKAIAGDVERLLADAAAAGHSLGGTGWRSTASQRALRLAHGYLSDSTPSGSGGRFPVAVPGRSRHEAGLAIDFQVGGRSLRRSDAAWRWLDATAARYGLRGLASEPWHWSVDGK